MNNFLERQTNLLGGPKPRGWNTSGGSSKNGSPVKGSPPAALPSGGGLPVFEKRVQLKEHLPHCARGDPTKYKSENPFMREVPLGDPILGQVQLTGRKSPTPVPGHGTPGKLPRPTIEHRPLSPSSHGSSSPDRNPPPQIMSTGARPSMLMAAAAGWSRPIEPTGDLEEIMQGGLGSPSLAPQGAGASTRSVGSGLTHVAAHLLALWPYAPEPGPPRRAAQGRHVP